MPLRNVVRPVVVLLAAMAVACEDSQRPEGEISTFDVQVYVESGDSVGFDAFDSPVNATITVASTFDDLVLVDATGADGTVTFEDLEAGGYTVSHVVIEGAEGAELQGNESQTVHAPFAGGLVVTRFIYQTVSDSTTTGD